MIKYTHEDWRQPVSMVNAAQTQFPNLKACSYDKGFHSAENQQELKTLLDQVELPKKANFPKLIKSVSTHRYSNA
jgi:IS5 family transposase